MTKTNLETLLLHYDEMREQGIIFLSAHGHYRLRQVYEYLIGQEFFSKEELELLEALNLLFQVSAVLPEDTEFTEEERNLLENWDGNP